MNVVDSTAWLAYFADAENAGEFAPVVQDAANLLVPTIALYEVFKVLARERGDEIAIEAVSAMMQGTVVDIDATRALAAARISATYALPMADSLIYAICDEFDAVLWTQDADFKGMPRVEYRSS